MRVCQVVPRYPPQTGGVETHVREISERLVARGHDVKVVTADAAANGDRRETRSGVSVRRCRGVEPGGAFHVAPGVARAVREVNADVVHAHNYHALPLLFAAVAAGGSRLVTTPHYHGGSASSVRDRLLTLYRPLGRWALRRADAIVAVSDWECERLADDFGVEVTVVPNGIDVERFRDADPLEWERPYLLTVGRLERYKGVQHVIRALPELPDYDLLVAGIGDYGDRLREVAREAEVTDRVDFLGYVADERLPSLYAGAEAYVTLSAFEAYGLTVGEALAAGTPCLVRRAGALVDWTDSDGVVGIDSVGRETVAPAVERAVSCTVGRASVVGWDEVVDRLLNVYAEAEG